MIKPFKKCGSGGESVKILIHLNSGKGRIIFDFFPDIDSFSKIR